MRRLTWLFFVLFIGVYFCIYHYVNSQYAVVFTIVTAVSLVSLWRIAPERQLKELIVVKKPAWLIMILLPAFYFALTSTSFLEIILSAIATILFFTAVFEFGNKVFKL